MIHRQTFGTFMLSTNACYKSKTSQFDFSLRLFFTFFKNHNVYQVYNAQSFADHLLKSHDLKASAFRAIGVLKDTIIEKWTWLTACHTIMWNLFRFAFFFH